MKKRYSVAEVAEITAYSQETVRNLLLSGVIPGSVKEGKRNLYIIPAEAFDEWWKGEKR